MSDAINPMERDGCWLCDGCGEIETHRASDDAPLTVGCPVCVQSDLEWHLGRVKAERDALAAHVERARPMVEAYRSQLGGALWSLDDEEAEYAKDAEDWLSSNPTTSLARLKALWQAEVLDDAAEAFEAEEIHLVAAQALRHSAHELRRQAEGGE